MIEEQFKNISGYLDNHMGQCPDAYRYGFIDGACWQHEHNQWVSTKERLPEYDQIVLFLSEGIVRVGWLWESSNGVDYFYSRGTYSLDDVKAWMPIPECNIK